MPIFEARRRSGQKQQQNRQRQKVKSANLLSVVFFSGMSLGQPAWRVNKSIRSN